MTGEKARMFVALDLPGQVRDELAAWAREATAGARGVRVLAPDALHVTLCFLGWLRLDLAEEVATLALSCARPVAPLATAGAVWLPPRRPRVLAVDLEEKDGALAGLQQCASEALAAGIGYEPERRPYRPHVTVGRVAKGGSPTRGALADPPGLAFAGEALTLYRSRLERAGARYEPLARVALRAA